VTIGKAALQIAALALLALIVFDAYLSIDHLNRIQATAALSLESFGVQADIARVWQDFTDMETSQGGYLLTDDAAYLQPYTDAEKMMATHFANLRSVLTNRPESERSQSVQSIETQLESLAASMQAEIDRTIALRQQGYRHRAFQLVQTNQGKQYMDQARDLVSSLSSIESRRFAALEKERDASASKALVQIVAANLCLLLLTADLFLLIRYHQRGLEQEAAQSKQMLALRDSQLQKLMKLMYALGDQTRTQIEVIQENARLLLEKYDGFLPPAGYACAEQIKGGTAQLEQLRKELLGRPEFDIQGKAA
jgi:CHASE3 domain sensor protein